MGCVVKKFNKIRGTYIFYTTELRQDIRHYTVQNCCIAAFISTVDVLEIVNMRS
jgi:hypothetical protein